ncbi:glycoside-pentoside-hexuronide (GPH):cation symporter [Ruminococcaceae bacterium OttesenSCG-928-A16]|nr:glycoside-pentoside-hexuronide (GPH):cation symporter [Ruminococcaceae bacterium OttesenSCG-928-A16]
MKPNPIEQARAIEGGKVSALTRWSYGLGCIGRDANYTLFANFMMTYLTLAVGLTDPQLAIVGVIVVVGRIWDGVNDPLMGTIIDNTKTRFGKFKPYIIIGAVTNAMLTVLIFSGIIDPAVNWGLFIVMFGISYLLWDITYTMNDIGYWSMLPSLTINPKERERVSSLARIGANIGLFAVTALVPLFSAGVKLLPAYRAIAIGVAVLFVACQVLVVLGVKEQKNAITKAESHVGLKDMFKVIFKNDQLLAIIVSILLFNIGYFTTTGFGMQFFYFDYGNYGGMEFTLFAITIGISQIITLTFYPQLAKRLNRKQLFGLAIGLVVLGYLGFMAVGYLFPMNMVILCIIGFVLFSGQAIIQLLNLVLLADTIEYGQWKFGTRNEGIVFSLNPFINKVASAFQALIFAVTMIISGLNRYNQQINLLEKDTTLTKEQILEKGNQLVATIPSHMNLIMRLSMIVLPLALILASYVIYRTKYKIDDKMYAQIITDLEKRAETPGG